VPLIGLYSGMRLGEIIQLYVVDVKLEDAIYYFNVTPSPSDETGPDVKSVKNLSSIRIVPVHSELIKLGLFVFKLFETDRGLI